MKLELKMKARLLYWALELLALEFTFGFAPGDKQRH